MTSNVYVDVAGNYYESAYPFSVNDVLIPYVTPTFRAQLLAVPRKPNVTQKTIYLDNLGLSSDMKNGLVPATTVFQAAALELREYGGKVIVPPGDYWINGAILFYPGFQISGSAGATRLFSKDEWGPSVPGGRCFFASYNSAERFVDYDYPKEPGNILIEGLNMDYTLLSDSIFHGSTHGIRVFAFTNVTIQDCIMRAGANAVALLHCDGTKLINNTAYDFYNCAWDHWTEPRNALILGNTCITSIRTSQAVNFNPERTTGTALGLTAKGLIAANNYAEGPGIAADPNNLPWQIEPLVDGNSVSDVILSNNRLKNSYFVARGRVSNLAITGNNLENPEWPSAAIFCHSRSPTDYLDSVIISDNVLTGPAPNNALGNIYLSNANTRNCAILRNQINNSTGELRAGIYCPVPGTWISENTVTNGLYTYPGFVSTRQDMALLNNRTLSFNTPNGSRVNMKVQTDRFFAIQVPLANGSPKNIMYCLTETDEPEIQIATQLHFLDYTKYSVQELAAAGTTISTAALITKNVVRVTAATAGVAQGVQLDTRSSKTTVVWNDTAVNVNVYPANNGVGKINALSVAAPYVLAPGYVVTIVQLSNVVYLVMGAYP